MSGMSHKDEKRGVLDRLDPSRRAEAEARAKARAGVDNEAIEAKPAAKPTSVQAKPTPGLLGSGMAANAARALRARYVE